MPLLYNLLEFKYYEKNGLKSILYLMTNINILKNC